MTAVTATRSALRNAAVEGLRYAAYLVGYFGWEPCGPETHLHLYAHLNVAAGKTGLQYGERADDVQGLMGQMLSRSVGTESLFDWEAEPGRSTEDMHAALLVAGSEAT